MLCTGLMAQEGRIIGWTSVFENTRSILKMSSNAWHYVQQFMRKISCILDAVHEILWSVQFNIAFFCQSSPSLMVIEWISYIKCCDHWWKLAKVRDLIHQGSTCVVHHQPALCTMMHKVDLCPSDVGRPRHSIFTSRVSGRGNIIGPVCLSVCPCVCVSVS